MFLDFGDYRPDTPRVPRAISLREGVLFSLIVHAAFVVAVVFLPAAEWFQAAPTEVVPVKERDHVRFVDVKPLLDRPAPPKPTVDQSDLNRRSATRERAPRPDNTLPFSRGNTSEKVESANAPRPTVAEPPPAPASPPPDVPARAATPIPVSEPSPGDRLATSLKDLKRFIQKENFDNRSGGQNEQQADIQFDTMGVEFGPWLRRFKAQVERNWFVPQAAQLHAGHVVFQFYVLKNGTIMDLKMVKPSAIESFNTAAMNALRMSNPTLPLPPEYPVDRAFMTVTFHYNER